MPGNFSGITPRIISMNTDLSADTNIPVTKFPNAHTMTDAFYIPQNALTGNTTDFATMRVLNGKTTGNQTTNLAVAGYATAGKSVSWVAYTAKALTTNYTFSANHWLVWRYSEDGTVAFGTLTAVYWCVDGNV